VLVTAGTALLNKHKWWQHHPGPDPKSRPALFLTNAAGEAGLDCVETVNQPQPGDAA
jgi:hypothetical protein